MEPPPICRGKCSTGQEKQQFVVTPGFLRTPWQFGLSPNCLGSERVDFTTQKKGGTAGKRRLFPGERRISTLSVLSPVWRLILAQP